MNATPGPCSAQVFTTVHSTLHVGSLPWSLSTPATQLTDAPHIQTPTYTPLLRTQRLTPLPFHRLICKSRKEISSLPSLGRLLSRSLPHRFSQVYLFASPFSAPRSGLFPLLRSRSLTWVFLFVLRIHTVSSESVLLYFPFPLSYHSFPRERQLLVTHTHLVRGEPVT